MLVTIHYRYIRGDHELTAEMDCSVEKLGDGEYTYIWRGEPDPIDLALSDAEIVGAEEHAIEAYEAAFAEHSATKCGYGRDDQPFDQKDYCE